MTMGKPIHGEAALSPADSAEIKLTRQEWQIICGAVMLLAHNAMGDDAKQVKALSRRLEEYKAARGAHIEVWE